MQAALGRFDEFHQFAEVGRAVELSANLFQGLRCVELGAQQKAKCAFNGGEALAIESSPLQSDRVHAVAVRLALGDHARKRRHVLCNHGAGADIRVASDAAELVHGAKGSDTRVIIDVDVPGERGSIRENRVTANDAIVGNVRIGHEQIVAADPRDSASLRRAAADRRKLTKVVCISHHKFGSLAVEFQILRIPADRAKRIENIFPPNTRRPANDGVRLEHALLSEFDPVSDHRKRADARPVSDTSACGNDRSGIDSVHGLAPTAASAVASLVTTGASRSTNIHLRVASAAISPLTVATP